MDKLKSYILDLLFPRYCIGCVKILDDISESHLCSICRATMPVKGDFICAFCGSQVILGKTCPFCIKNKHLDRLLVATNYESPLVEKLLKTMKYNFVKSLADDAATVMIEYLKKKVLSELKFGPSSLIVVPVPIHRKRLNWRGFNQSEIIARGVGQYFTWQFDPDILKRIKNQTPQAEIKDRVSRIQNMIGVFECVKPELTIGKTIILVDDVSTTGSTLNDCARTLKNSGAKEVVGLVFARNR